MSKNKNSGPIIILDASSQFFWISRRDIPTINSMIVMAKRLHEKFGQISLKLGEVSCSGVKHIHFELRMGNTPLLYVQPVSAKGKDISYHVRTGNNDLPGNCLMEVATDKNFEWAVWSTFIKPGIDLILDEKFDTLQRMRKQLDAYEQEV